MSMKFYLSLHCSWRKLPLLLRGFALLSIIAVLAQGGVLWHLRRQSQIRHKFEMNASVEYGPSPISPVVEKQVDKLVPHGGMRLFSPMESALLAQAVDDDLKSIAEFTRLKELTISNGQLTEQGLSQIRDLNRLESLYVQNVSFTGDSLSGLPSCANLRRLKLIGPLMPEALRPLADCMALTELHLDAGYYEHNTERLTKRLSGYHLDAVARIPNLKRMIVCSNELPDTELRPLAAAGQLEELFVDTVTLNGDALNSLGKLPRLKQLILEVSDAAAAALQRLSGFPELQTLALRGGSIQPTHLTQLRNLNRLETLCLRGTDLKTSLEPIIQLKNLKNLNLFLAQLPPDALPQLERLQHLQELCLGINDAATEATTDELRQKFPMMLNVESRLTIWNQGTDIPKWEAAPASRAIGGGGGFF